MQSEAGTTLYLGKKLNADPHAVEKGGISASIRSFLLNRALRQKSKKYKAPAQVSQVPDRPDYAETKAALLKNRETLSEVLEKFSRSMAMRTYFKHPRAGKLNMEQTLQFLILHFERHLDQIKERSAA